MTELINANVRKLIGLAIELDEQQWQDGLNWYQIAHDFAVTLAVRYGTTTDRAAGIIAALSPQTSWESNKATAEMTCKALSEGRIPTGREHGQTQANAGKAIAIWDGVDVMDVLDANGGKSGHKVRSFYKCIANPTDPEPVCIDRHAIKAWATDADTWVHITPNRYARLKRDYQTGAASLGVLPMQFQALCWIAQRGASF